MQVTTGAQDRGSFVPMRTRLIPRGIVAAAATVDGDG
jgi:hypothetical protein